MRQRPTGPHRPAGTKPAAPETARPPAAGAGPRRWASGRRGLAGAGLFAGEYRVLQEAQRGVQRAFAAGDADVVASLMVRKTLFGQFFSARSALSSGVWVSMSP